MLDTRIGSQVLISNYAKKGSLRLAPGEKRGGQKITYGNEVVDLTLEITDYMTLVAQELSALRNADLELILKVASERGYKCWEGRGKKAVQRDLDLDDLSQGLKSLIDKRVKALANDEKSDTYTPLAKGVKQHNETGETYVSGILVDERVVTPAPNGHLPPSKSGGKAVAEKVISRILNLKSRKWRQYRLTEGSVTVL